jgi:hypothetical protein
MKKILALLLMIALLSQSCMTTYDAYGRPVQSVDPGVATASVITAGAVGFILGASSYDNYGYYGGCDRSYYFRPYSRGHYSCY